MKLDLQQERTDANNIKNTIARRHRHRQHSADRRASPHRRQRRQRERLTLSFKILASQADCGANGGERGLPSSSVTQAQPTQTVILLPHFPHPSNHTRPFPSQLGDEKQ
ncbi:hypothetical protein EYF80_007392 [Liparis tanakae]|uniref:Uncharacterized protein n=1 Tax=Liparis tanakae TaxID=230148 RepID=A0A4Z2IY94_9TELE|nr:hypothetical protein EYF80_007392 [Liparis tanakae]